MGKRVTLKELAGKLNVSISTVSKALSNSPEINKTTKKRIQDMAEKCNYAPNLAARSLKTKTTKTIGVIIPNILPFFFAKILSGIEREVSKRGYNIITCITDESCKKESKSVQMLASGSVDGFIISLSSETQLMERYEHIKNSMSNGTPVVLFDRVTHAIDCDKVVADDHAAAYNATQYLMDTGCANIVFICPIHHTSVGKERTKGYLDALKERIAYKASPHVINVSNYEDIRDSLKKTQEKSTIDAIFASDEASGIYAMNAMISLGYHIPDDVSIIGFTDGIISANSNPPLTTISQHGITMGEVAARKLIARLEDKNTEAFSTTIINTSLIKRGSTRPSLNEL